MERDNRKGYNGNNYECYVILVVENINQNLGLILSQTNPGFSVSAVEVF